MKRNFGRLFKNEELKNRMIVLIIALSIFKIGTLIPAPFVNSSAISFGENGAFGLFDVLTGGALASFSIFAIGIMPYITASIIIMLLQTNVIPLLNEWSQQGEFGQKKLKKTTYTLTLILAFLQSIGISIGFDRMYHIVHEPTWWKFAIISFTLTAGTIILVILGEWVEHKGIGRGISMIILAGILMALPQHVVEYIQLNFMGEQDNLFLNGVMAVLLLILIYGLLAFAIFGNGGKRKIPMIQSSKGQWDVKTGRKSFFPIPVITTGVIPVIFASALFSFPMLIGEFTTNGTYHTLVNWLFSFEKITGVLLYAVLVYFFSLFYALIQFDPKKISQNLRESEMFIPTVRAGEETELYFHYTIARISKIGAFLLVAISVVPMILTMIFSLPQGIAFIGTSLLIVVSVAIDFQSQLDTELQKSSYYRFIGNESKVN